jgi:hypothetical protein
VLHLPYAPALPTWTQRLELRAFTAEDYQAFLGNRGTRSSVVAGVTPAVVGVRGLADIVRQAVATM